MATKFIATKGGGRLATEQYYIGHVQHERTMSIKQTYAHLSEKLGFTAAKIKSAFLGLKACWKEFAGKGNASFFDGVTTVHNVCRGPFAGSKGPWVKGKNYLTVESSEHMAFKDALGGIVPVNNTEGAKPTISSVLDNVTGEYDAITGMDAFTVGGVDLAPNTEKEDEFVGVIGVDGTLTKASVTTSELQVVKAQLTTELEAGEYTLVVATRSGLDEEFGVKRATRKIEIK